MSSQPPNKDSQSSSLWNSVIKKLGLGPDQAAPIKPLADPLDMDGLDLDLLPPDPVSQPATKSGASKKAAAKPAAPPSSRVKDSVTFDDDFDTAADEPAAGDSRREPAEVFFSDEEDAVDEDLVAPAQAETEDAVPERTDEYWDALRELDTGDDDAAEASPAAGRGGGRGGRGGGGGGRGRSGRGDSSRGGRSGGDRGESRGRSERSSRTSDSERRRASSRPAPVAEELFADDDFGTGLVEESRAQVAAYEDIIDEVDDELDVTTSAGEEGEAAETDEPRKRRRRRGRRGRGRSRSESTASETVSTVKPEEVLFDDGDEEESPAFTPVSPARVERPAAKPPAPRRPAPVDFDEPEEIDDEPLPAAAARRDEAEDEADDEEPRDSRSRRGRGRGRSRDGARSAETGRSAAPRRPVVEPAGESEEDAEMIERNKDKYRNIPTWEEAISYLVRPKRRPGDSRGPRSRGSRPSRPRSAD